MQSLTRPQVNSQSKPDRLVWKEYRLLFYSAVVGVAGGLAAQIFVWLLKVAEGLLLWGIAGYKPPEPGTLNPESTLDHGAFG